MGKSISPRASARRAALAYVASVNERFSWLKKQWTVTSTIYDFDGLRDEDGKPPATWCGNVDVRPRRVDEYPENNHADWHALIDQLDAAKAEIESLRQYAIDMWHETQEEEWDRLHSEQSEVQS